MVSYLVASTLSLRLAIVRLRPVLAKGMLVAQRVADRDSVRIDRQCMRGERREFLHDNGSVRRIGGRPSPAKRRMSRPKQRDTLADLAPPSAGQWRHRYSPRNPILFPPRFWRAGIRRHFAQLAKSRGGRAGRPGCWKRIWNWFATGPVLYTFGNASGISREHGLVVIKPSEFPIGK
jgi:hypothetical protein